MNAELRRADEVHEIRRAIARWRKAGAIDEATAAALQARFPDDRVRSRLPFRVLFFVLTLFAGSTAWGTMAAMFGVGFHGRQEIVHAVWLAVLAAAAFWGIELAVGRLRLRGFGVEEGLAALALGFGTASAFLFGEQLDLSESGGFAGLGLVIVALAGGIALRWGIPGSAAAASGGLLLALSGLATPKLAWLAAALVLLPLARRQRRDADVPVAWRRRAGEVFLVFAVALWLAAHPARLGHQGLLGDGEWTLLYPGLEELLTLVGWTVLFALPAALLLSGFSGRDRFELTLGAIGALAGGASLVDALDAGPVWAVLLVAGLLLGGFALACWRAFAARPERVRRGFTDRPLFGEEAEASWLELAATLAVFTPTPRSAPQPVGLGGGGEFGGGGASSKF